MQKTKLLTILAIGIIMIAGSCSKKNKTGPTGATGPAGPAGPAYRGVINGHISAYDQYGTSILTNLDNVQLTLQGGKTVTTDKNGYFFFDSVTTGTYKITASGGAYAATMVNNVSFISDTLYKHIYLSAKPTFNLDAFTAIYNTGSGFDSLIIDVTPDTRVRSFIVLINNKPTVDNQPANYLLSYVRTINANVGRVLLKIPASDLNNAAIFYGEPVYFAAYSYSVNDASAYEDPATGKNVYNAVGTAVLTASAPCP